MIWSVRQNASASLLYITSTATVAMAVEQKIYPPYEAVAWENSWNFRDATTVLSANWLVENKHRKSILMICHYQDLNSALIGWKFTLTSQKHNPVSGYSNTSLAWDFCTHSSDVNLEGNQQWCSKMSAVFSDLWYSCHLHDVNQQLKNSLWLEIATEHRQPS